MIDPQKHPGKERKRWLLAGYWMLGSEILIEFEKIPYSSHKQLVPTKAHHNIRFPLLHLFPGQARLFQGLNLDVGVPGWMPA